MKAIIYGTSRTLQLGELADPVPAADEVLLQAHAASVNPLDGHFMKVNPLDGHFMKTAPMVRNLGFKMLRLKVKRPGADVAGEVEAVGRNVTRFTPGDAV